MSAIKLSTPSSGSISLSPANTASNLTITVPAVTGTMLTTASTFGATGPAFSVYTNATQPAVSATTWTKITFQAKEFDTASCFDNTTNYRFTPNVAGYYSIFAIVSTPLTANTGGALLSFYKNGSLYCIGGSAVGNSLLGANTCGSTTIYLNGTTDYIEVYLYVTTSLTPNIGRTNTQFSGALVRAA